MKKVQEAGVFAFKERVGHIADFLKSQGYDVKHMDLVEGISRYEGARDWRTHRAKLAITPAALVPVSAHGHVTSSPEETSGAITEGQSYAMLEMLYEWDDNLSFSEIIEILRGTKKTGYVSAINSNMPKAQLADELEKISKERDEELSPIFRYVHGMFQHDFLGEGRDIEIRFVFDVSEDKLLNLDIAHNRMLGWGYSSETARTNFESALRTDYAEVLMLPEAAGLERSNELPDWAR